MFIIIIVNKKSIIIIIISSSGCRICISIIKKNKLKIFMIQYLHEYLFSPICETICFI